MKTAPNSIPPTGEITTRTLSHDGRTADMHVLALARTRCHRCDGAIGFGPYSLGVESEMRMIRGLSEPLTLSRLHYYHASCFNLL